MNASVTRALVDMGLADQQLSRALQEREDSRRSFDSWHLHQRNTEAPGETAANDIAHVKAKGRLRSACDVVSRGYANYERARRDLLGVVRTQLAEPVHGNADDLDRLEPTGEGSTR
jgi:hypothetical protein